MERNADSTDLSVYLRMFELDHGYSHIFLERFTAFLKMIQAFLKIRTQYSRYNNHEKFSFSNEMNRTFFMQMKH